MRFSTRCTPRRRLGGSGAGLVAALALVVSGVRAAAPPNLIVVVADDLRWDALGCAGNAQIQTPQLDRLAAEGTRFVNAFVTTSICSVSRASLFSGQYARRHGIADFSTGFTPAAWANTYPAQLRQRGYWTGFVGKFGVGTVMPTNGFDFWAGFPGQGVYFAASNGPHLTRRMGEDALDFLRAAAQRQPFCLSISFKAPHAQDGAPREFPPDPADTTLYDELWIPPPPAAAPEFHAALPEAVRRSEGRTRWLRRFDTTDRYQQSVRDYYRLVSGIDREIGRLRAVLESRQLAANTVILFTSDNGFALGDRGLSDKWFMYEESIRVPLLVMDPRLPAAARGRVCEAQVLNLDVAPTLLEFAAAPVPGAMQGRSLKPWIEGRRPRSWRTSWFYEHHFGPEIIPPSEGVRTSRWKYIRYLGAAPIEQLFDLKHDPLERRNLATDSRHRGVLGRLRAEWAQSAAALR